MGRFGVVGAGVAGLVAAHRLQASGHDVAVYERADQVGGRTRTVRLPHGHVLDTGAAWLASFYPLALQYCDGLRLLDRDVAGTPRLRLPDGRIAAAPFSPMHLAASELLPLRQRARFARWAAVGLARGTSIGPRPGLRQPGDLVDARTEALRRVGTESVEYVLRPAFETMVFSPLEELSAAFVSGWLAGAASARYCVPAEGMDTPWRRLAGLLTVHTGRQVTGVRPDGGGVVIEPTGEWFDGVVVAVPAPVVCSIVAPGPWLPAWLPRVRYSSEVFGYAAQQASAPPPASDIHPAGPGPHRVGSVQLLPGGDARVPPGWQAEVVSASGSWSAELLSLTDDEVLHHLWDEGRQLEPELCALGDATLTHVVRWRHAVPVFGPGHLTRLAGWEPLPPIALAGDWSVYPCIEGAARSGVRAAEALLGA